MTGTTAPGPPRLIACTVALSFVLLAGARLFVRTFSTLIITPLVFKPEGLMSSPPTRTGPISHQTDRGIRATGRRGGLD